MITIMSAFERAFIERIPFNFLVLRKQTRMQQMRICCSSYRLVNTKMECLIRDVRDEGRILARL